MDDEQLRQQFNQFNSQIDQQEQEQGGSFLTDTALPAAGGIIGGIGGSFVSPIAGTAAGGAAGSAAGTALGNIIEGEDDLTEDVAKEAALGGAFSFGGPALRLGKAALSSGGRAALGSLDDAARVASGSAKATGGEVVEQGANKATKLGDNLQRSVLAPEEAFTKGQVGSFTGREVDSIAELGKRYLPKGSAQFKLSKTPDVADNILNEVDSLVGQSTKKTSAKAVGDQVSKNLDDLGLLSTNAQKRTADSIMSKINDFADETGNLTAKQLNKFRRELNKNLGRAYNNVSKGNPASNADEIRLSVKESVDEVFPNLIDDSANMGRIQRLNQDLKTLNDASKALFSRATQPANVPIVGSIRSKGLSRGLQSASDRTGRALESAGRTASRVNTPSVAGRQAGRGVAGTTASQALPRMATSEQEGTTQGQQQPQTIDDVLNQQVGAGVQPGGMQGGLQGAQTGSPFGQTTGTTGTTGTQQQSTYPIENAIADMRRDPENADFYEQLYEFSNQGQNELSEEEQKFQQVSSTLDELEQLYNQAGGASGRVGGAVEAAQGLVGLDSEAQAYRQMRKASASQMSKALGESGRLTDQDIKRALNAIPDVTDTPEEARIKFQSLRQLLSSSVGAGAGLQPQQTQQSQPTDLNQAAASSLGL